ncbi:MAG: DUF4352 domain-containing protein [Acidimicrobiales bacterium]
MAQSELVCERDGEATRLKCSQCEQPICPKCLVRTPVGMKCTTCGAPTHRARKNRTALLVPVVVIVAVFGVLVVPRLLSKSDDSATNVDTAPRVPNAEGPARFARIGMEARDGDMAFTITTFECGSTQVEGRSAQGKFCFVAVDMKNYGRVPVTFIARAQMLQDPQNRQFGPDMAVTAVHPANTGHDLGSLVINPGNSLQGVLVYDVPPEAQPEVATFRAGPRGPGAFVRLSPPS